MRRSVRSARKQLDLLAPDLNPEMYRRFQEEIYQASNRAVVVATDYAKSRAGDHTALRDDLQSEANSLQRSYDALVAEGEQGGFTAREYEDRFNVLERRKRDLSHRRHQLEELTAVVEAIEDDPEAWTDATFYERYPALAPAFSF